MNPIMYFLSLWERTKC